MKDMFTKPIVEKLTSLRKYTLPGDEVALIKGLSYSVITEGSLAPSVDKNSEVFRVRNPLLNYSQEVSHNTYDFYELKGTVSVELFLMYDDNIPRDSEESEDFYLRQFYDKVVKVNNFSVKEKNLVDILATELTTVMETELVRKKANDLGKAELRRETRIIAMNISKHLEQTYGLGITIKSVNITNEYFEKAGALERLRRDTESDVIKFELEVQRNAAETRLRLSEGEQDVVDNNFKELMDAYKKGLKSGAHAKGVMNGLGAQPSEINYINKVDTLFVGNWTPEEAEDSKSSKKKRKSSKR